MDSSSPVIASFTTIPFPDIQTLLLSYNIPFSSNDYQNALNLIFSGTVQSAPQSIINWIRAYHLINEDIPLTTLSSVLTDPTPISNLLGVQDREQIISILQYLDKLVDDMSLYDTLPDDLLMLLLEHFDCQSILLSCKFSSRFKHICDSGRMLPLLQRKIKQNIGFDTNDINKLKGLCQYEYYNKRKYIFAGDEVSYVVMDGSPYVFGDSTYGLDEWTDKETPTELNVTNIVQISTSKYHTLYLDNKGQVYVSGYNDKGQLGIGDMEWEGGEQLNPYLNNIISISVGYAHSLVLDSSGQVYSFGSNEYGQLGLGDNIDRNIPTLIPGFNNVVQIVANEYVSTILTNNGQIYVSGLMSENLNSFILVPELINIIQISLHSGRLLALNNQGQVYMYYYSAFIPGSNTPLLILESFNIAQILVTHNNIILLTIDGLIYILARLWGGNFSDTLVDIPANIEYNIFGNATYTIPILIPNLINVVQIAAGDYHVLALTNTGDIYAFGQNEEGQLGLDDFISRKIPTIIPNLKIRF